MTESDERYARQLKLAEVGPAGQARLAALTATVPNAPGSDVQREYLERAGVRHFQPHGKAERFAHAEHFQHEACRAVAFGAWRALRQIRGVLASGGERV